MLRWLYLDVPTLKGQPWAKLWRPLLLLALLGALMGWLLGEGAARTPVPDGDIPLGRAGNIAVSIGGALTAMLYGYVGMFKAKWPAVVIGYPLLFGLVAATLSGIFWILPWGPLLSFMTVPIALFLACTPTGPAFIPPILFAPLCAWVCRLALRLMQAA